MGIAEGKERIAGPVTVEVTGSSLTDGTGLITRLAQNKATIANAAAITDTTVKSYNLISHGGLTEDQIRRYQEFKVSIYNTHNQAAKIWVFGPVMARNTAAQGGTELYTEDSAVDATTGVLIIQAGAGGTGVGANIKDVPALRGLFSNLIVNVQYAVAPTSGAITVVVEMR